MIIITLTASLITSLRSMSSSIARCGRAGRGGGVQIRAAALLLQFRAVRTVEVRVVVAAVFEGIAVVFIAIAIIFRVIALIFKVTAAVFRLPPFRIPAFAFAFVFVFVFVFVFGVHTVNSNRPVQDRRNPYSLA